MAEMDTHPEDQAVFNRLKSTGRISHGLRRVMTQQWNQCAGCGRGISKGRPGFAGYKADGRPTMVGACCADQLSQLATPVYWTGTLNLSIEDNEPVWRYMDFAKFVAMLQNGGLYFPRADKLEDPFEGAAGLARREADWDQFYLDFFRKAITTPPPGQKALSVENVEAEAKRLLHELKLSYSRARSLLVNCWHANNVESEALWRLYAPSPSLGVAIRTNVGRLWDATAYDSTAIVGRVHYLDFRHSFADAHHRIFCKRSSLSHEREIRVTLQNNHERPVPGKLLVCDLNSLVEEVVISPFAPEWFYEVLSGVIKKYGYSFNSRKSELLEEPFY